MGANLGKCCVAGESGTVPFGKALEGDADVGAAPMLDFAEPSQPLWLEQAEAVRVEERKQAEAERRKTEEEHRQAVQERYKAEEAMIDEIMLATVAEPAKPPPPPPPPPPRTAEEEDKNKKIPPPRSPRSGSDGEQPSPRTAAAKAEAVRAPKSKTGSGKEKRPSIGEEDLGGASPHERGGVSPRNGGELRSAKLIKGSEAGLAAVKVTGGGAGAVGAGAPATNVGGGPRQAMSTKSHEEFVQSVAKPKPTATQKVAPGKGELFHKLQVNIHSARGLRNADFDMGGTSDPFCVVDIPGFKGGQGTSFHTRVIDDDTNPFWEHIVEITGWSSDDFFRFSVWDKDTFSADDLLGKAELKKDRILPGGWQGELRLSETSETSVSYDSHLHVKVDVLESYLGQPRPDTKMVIKKISEGGVGVGPRMQDEDAPKLWVTLVSARGLRNADWGTLGGLSDPYCTCEIPGKVSSRITSQVIDNKLDPVWNYQAQVYDYEIGDSLSIAILDKDVGSKDDLLGRTKITRDMVLKGFEGELALEDAGKKQKAFVTVKVRVEHPPPKKKEEPSPAGSDASTATPADAISPKVTPRGGNRRGSGTGLSPRGSSASRNSGSAGSADDKSKAFLDAAKKGDVLAVKRMLEEEGVAVDITGEQGVTALHLACCCGHADLVALLLKNKGKNKLLLAKTPENRETALHAAARKDYKQIAEMLIKAGISTTVKSRSGKTPADMAKGQLATWLRHEDPASTPTTW